jgi:hypothetical protein
MLSSAKRRISLLEHSIQLPITAQRFLVLVEERVRLTGASFDDASQSLIVSLNDQDLDCLAEEFERRGFGAVRNASTTRA